MGKCHGSVDVISKDGSSHSIVSVVASIDDFIHITEFHDQLDRAKYLRKDRFIMRLIKSIFTFYL